MVVVETRCVILLGSRTMAGSGLATVMFTDLVGSTRMRERLGDDVADEVGVEHDRIIGDSLSSTGGRLVKNLGDGALAVFDSSVDAVVAGQRIQEGVALYNRQTDETREIGVRIGINAGEIARDNGDIIGLPVAIASRVCAEAGGGQILITDTVRLLIGRRARFPYVSIGARALKGVDGVIELWSIEETAISDVSRTRADIPFPAFLGRAIPTNLVGREKQMAQLDMAYTKAADTVELVAVIGEPGIGKTSLTSTWSRAAADAGATVVAGRCTPDAALPYQPFVEIARSILGARPELLLDVGPAAGNISQLVPGIEIPRGLPVPVQTDPDTTRYLMAEAFAALLQPQYGEPPTVVVLDDLHWADEHSIAVLAHIVRRDELTALIIGTYRDTDLVRSHPLPRLLADLRREHQIVRIPLPRLSADEVDEMISGHFGAATAPEVVQSISEETQGNPFFVEEITTHLQNEGAIDDDGQWISDTPIADYGIPEGVREVVGRRLEHLGEDAVSMLEVAAVIGPDFSIDIAGSIAGLDERAIDTAIDAAMNARVIKEGDGADEFAFAHALLRQTLYDDLPTRRRTRIHRAVGEALEQRKTAPAILLYHWLRAERPAKALEAALAASTAAEETFVPSDITANLELALELWDDVDDAEGAAGTNHADLVIRLTRAQFDFGGLPEGTNELITAELERADLDSRTRALLYSSLSQHLGHRGRTPEALEAGDEALRLVPKDEPSSAHADILAAISRQRMLNAQSTEAISLARKALDLAQAVGSERAEQEALSTLATATGMLGDIEASNEYFRQLREMAERTGSMRYRLIGYVNQAETLAINNRIGEALETTLAGIARTSELGLDRWVAMLHGNAAELLFYTGRWDDAAIHLAAAPAVEIDHPQIVVSLSTIRLAAERGDAERIEAETNRLESAHVAESDTQVRGPFWASRVSDLRWRGEIGEAYRLGADGLGTLVHDEAWKDTAQLTAATIETIADAAGTATVEPEWLENARRWHSGFEGNPAPVLHGAALHATATADLARAEGTNSPDLWRLATDAWSDSPYFEAKAKWRLAQALAESDPTNAEITALLDEAGEVARRLKARPLLEAIGATRENTSQ
jgi:class 3 adenylate cyclase/tetratricopeptide (TPR) repeat protein